MGGGGDGAKRVAVSSADTSAVAPGSIGVLLKAVSGD
jgi:hypothetical protein